MSDIFDMAPEGQIYVCAACGKTSHNRAGFDRSSGRGVAERHWDESCMLHAVLCYETKNEDGSWQAVPEET